MKNHVIQWLATPGTPNSNRFQLYSTRALAQTYEKQHANGWNHTEIIGQWWGKKGEINDREIVGKLGKKGTHIFGNRREQFTRTHQQKFLDRWNNWLIINSMISSSTVVTNHNHEDSVQNKHQQSAKPSSASSKDHQQSSISSNSNSNSNSNYLQSFTIISNH